MQEYELKLTPLFIQDLEKIYSWIHAENPYNAINFVDKIEATVKSLKYSPEKFATAYESESFQSTNLRQVICLNHRIIYRVKPNSVDVLTILSCRQDLIDKKALKTIIK